MRKSHWLLLALLTALFAGAVWYCVLVWKATPPMPLYGNIIMVAAAILVMATGSGLIALMFYSHRKGYDEPARSNERTRGNRTPLE